MQKKPEAILFDLDGTLVDTAPDLLAAINHLRLSYSLPLLSPAEARPLISFGSKTIMKEVLGVGEDDERFPILREQLFKFYDARLANETVFFPFVNEVITYCKENQLPWGIVTNKLTRHTKPLLQQMPFSTPPDCVVCGDTLATCKPDPEPVRYACKLLGKEPAQCWFVGDSIADMQASRAAGTRSILAAYGYLPEDVDINLWQADAVIHSPKQLLDLLC